MSDNNLILFPRNERNRLQCYDGMLRHLREIGLIGELSRYKWPHEYEQGFSFFNLIQFRTHHMVTELITDAAGQLQKGPTKESSGFCRIRFAPGHEKPQVIASPLTEAVRCSTCGQVDEEWTDVLSAWHKATLALREYRHRCVGCGKESRINELDWEHTCGVATYQIDILGIRKDEAIPSEKILQLLWNFTSVEWDYVIV